LLAGRKGYAVRHLCRRVWNSLKGLTTRLKSFITKISASFTNCEETWIHAPSTGAYVCAAVGALERYGPRGCYKMMTLYRQFGATLAMTSAGVTVAAWQETQN
jgi:hypothetical protein